MAPAPRPSPHFPPNPNPRSPLPLSLPLPAGILVDQVQLVAAPGCGCSLGAGDVCMTVNGATGLGLTRTLADTILQAPADQAQPVPASIAGTATNAGGQLIPKRSCRFLRNEILAQIPQQPFWPGTAAVAAARNLTGLVQSVECTYTGPLVVGVNIDVTYFSCLDSPKYARHAVEPCMLSAPRLGRPGAS